MDFKKLISELRPDTSISNEIEEVLSKINTNLKNSKLNAICVAGGSVAKGTFLRGDFDVDLFVKFDLKYKDNSISDLLEKALDFKIQRVHGSRDYFQFRQGNLNYEIVPVLDYKNPEDSENVTDMSHMHVDWVKKKLKKGQEDEIRLAKKFCKALGCYGAESHIQGFSGHVLDILVIHYSTFMNLLKESQKWKPKIVIDVMKHFRNNQEILFTLNQSKIHGPMILIDPILKTRNAASALSYEKMIIFKRAAAKFLKNPSEDFFQEQIIDEAFLKKKYKKNIFILHLKIDPGKSDVIGSKIVKAQKFIRSEMKHVGFEIKHSGWYWNNKFSAIIWIVLKNISLPNSKIVEGPPIEMRNACIDFKKNYKDTVEKNKKLCAKVEIKIRDASANLEEICKKEYFQEKVKLTKMSFIN